MIVAGPLGGKMRSGLVAVVAIVGLAAGLATLALRGKPSALRRPAAVERPVLLVPDFVNRTGDGTLGDLARGLTEAVRERLAAPESIFVVSPRRLRPVLGPEEREDGLVRIAARLGADYVLVGSLESGPEVPLGPGSAWGATGAAPADPGTDDGVRVDVLLVRDADPPEVFAERFPLGEDLGDAAVRERTVRIIADRIALSLRSP